MRKALLMIVLISILFLTGCATILNGNPSLLSIVTNPENAKITITGLNNMERITKTSPCTVYLNKATDYSIKINLSGYESEEIPIRRTVTGWFWGNLLLGGVIGMVVDYSTSNMYEHNPTVINLDLTKLASLPDTIAIEYPVKLLMADGSSVIKNLPITFHKI